MRLKWLRTWTFAAIAAAVAAIIIVNILADRYTREPPNYTEIEDGLWLGGYVAEPPPGTQAVLNLCETEDQYRVKSHRWEPIRDGEPVPTMDWLREQVAFIESERKLGHIVYVHCRNGVSRSGMVLTAYFMKREKWSREQALEFLRSRRPIVRANPAFMRLLGEWEVVMRSE